MELENKILWWNFERAHVSKIATEIQRREKVLKAVRAKKIFTGKKYWAQHSYVNRVLKDESNEEHPKQG